MPGAQVAETSYRPQSWKHEPLRLIVRRVPFTAPRSPSSKAHAPEDDPPRAAPARPRQTDRLRLRYSFVLTDIHWQPPPDRTLPPTPRPDRRAAQGVKAWPGAAPPALRDEHANRVWLTAALLALNLTAFCCTCAPPPSVKQGARNAPLRAQQDASQPDVHHPRASYTPTDIILRPPAATATATSSRRHSTRSTRSTLIHRPPPTAHHPPPTIQPQTTTIRRPQKPLDHRPQTSQPAATPPAKRHSPPAAPHHTLTSPRHILPLIH